MALDGISSKNYHMVRYSSEKVPNYEAILPRDIIFRYNHSKLRSIAKRQIDHLSKQIDFHPEKRSLYTYLKNRVILHESLLKIFQFYNNFTKGVINE